MEDQTLQSYILGPMTKTTSYPQDDSSSITKDTEQSKHWQMNFKSEHYWRSYFYISISMAQSIVKPVPLFYLFFLSFDFLESLNMLTGWFCTSCEIKLWKVQWLTSQIHLFEPKYDQITYRCLSGILQILYIKKTHRITTLSVIDKCCFCEAVLLHRHIGCTTVPHTALCWADTLT